MILIQNLLSSLQIQIISGIFTPGKTYERLKIIQKYIEFRTLRIQIVQLVGFLKKSLTDLCRPFFSFCLLQQFIFLRRRFVTHLCLHVLNLLLQEVVALLFINILTSLVTDVSFQILKVDFAIDDFHHIEETFFYRLHLQQLDLFLNREWHVRAYEVQCHDIIGNILDGKGCFVGDVLTYIYILINKIAKVIHSCFELTIPFFRIQIRQCLNITLKIG